MIDFTPGPMEHRDTHDGREPLSNLSMYCKGHAPQPDAALQLHPAEWFVGKYCKLPFKIDPPVDGCECEDMWVHCTAVDGDTMLGILNNDPVFALEYTNGDEIEFFKAEIEDVH